MSENKKTLTCLGCRKWKGEEELIISPKGAFCEECYFDMS
jgi:hypothetical protein